MSERKAFNFYRSYYDVFKELSKKDKLDFIEALLDRQFTGLEPKKLDGMAKFAYISQKSNIDSQIKGWEDKTRCKLGSSHPTEGGSQGGLFTPTVQEKEEEKEEEKEKGIKGDKSPVSFPFKKSIIDLGVEEEIVSDWLKVRKAKKSSNTKTAFNALVKQIESSGISANECIKKSVENSWAGFKAEWLKSSFTIKPQKQTSMAVSDYSVKKPEDNIF